MADTITKILIRKGLDVQRRTADSTGIIFSSGEPGWCYDTKRLFIGDGLTSGGKPVGSQFIGSVQQFYGGATNGFTNEALNIFNVNGATYGDILYDRDTRSIYVLTSSNNFPPLSSEFIKLDVSPLLDPDMLEYDSSRQIQIKNGGVGPYQLSFGVVDGSTLTKASFSDPISIANSGVTNIKLANMKPFSFKANPYSTVSGPLDIEVYPRTLIGRTASSVLTCFSFDTVLAQANIVGQNGILISSNGNSFTIRNDSTKISLGSTSINLFKPTTINSTLSVTSNIFAAGDIIAYAALSDKRVKDDIKLINSSIQKVERLNGYEFKFNDNAPEHLKDRQSYGLIAQELQEILPHAVEYRDKYLGINYDQVIPLLVECIKELKKEIELLKCNLKSK
jgi:hypothetical protein